MTDAIRHGSALDDFLREEGVFEQFEAQAIKEVIAWQFQEELKRRRMSKPRFAELMGTSRAQVDRLLDPAKGNVTLSTIVRAAGVMGKTVSLQLMDPSPGVYKKAQPVAALGEPREAGPKKRLVRRSKRKAQPVAHKRAAARA